MIEKLKNVLGIFKELLVFVITPIIFLIGFIYYLLTQNKLLKEENAEEHATGQLKELQGEQKQVDNNANTADASYEILRNQYLGLHTANPGSRQGSGSQNGADSSKGPGTDPGPDAA
jgi:cbb3-type cytochrome oxidase subunit 3